MRTGSLTRAGRVAAAAALALGIGARPVRAQRLLDWPIRTGIEADAVATGPAAAFWNPAGAGGGGEERGQAFLEDIEGYRESGLGGVALGGSIRLQEGFYLAAGFSHLGVGPIPLTGSSPADQTGEINVTEDLLGVAAARDLGGGVWVGVGGQYARSDDAYSARSRTSLGTGLAWRPPARGLEPVVGASIWSRGGGAEWNAGAGLGHILEPVDGLLLGASYGVSDDAGPLGPSHRVSATARWNRLLGLSAGVQGDDGADGLSWSPIVSGDLQLGRYRLAVIREGIANGFGAAYYYQIHVEF